MFSTVFTSLHSAPYFFFLFRSLSLSLSTIFDAISSNINEVLSINSPANVFVCRDFSVHHKGWLTYSGELCYNFSISNDLTQMVNFCTRIPDCDSHSPLTVTLTILLFWICFFFSDASICSTMVLPSFGNSDYVVSVSTDFQ